MASHCTYITTVLLKYFLAPVYAAEFVIGFPANLFVILVYVFCLPSWKSTNVYMFNLAISDLIFLSTLPVLTYNYMHNIQFNPDICVVNRYILHVNLYASILFMVWVGVDRFLLLWYPQRNHFLLTRKASWLVSLVNWIWVTVDTGPLINFIISDLKHNNWTICNDFGSLNDTTPVLTYSLFLTAVAYMLPLLTLCLLTCRMVSLLKQREEVLGTSYQRPLNIVRAAAVMLLVLYMPIHVMRNLRLASQLSELELSECTKAYIEAVYIITRPIAFAHSVINPAFYVLITDRFREVLQDKWKHLGRLIRLRRLS